LGAILGLTSACPAATTKPLRYSERGCPARKASRISTSRADNLTVTPTVLALEPSLGRTIRGPYREPVHPNPAHKPDTYTCRSQGIFAERGSDRCAGRAGGPRGVGHVTRASAPGDAVKLTRLTPVG
jgi:hypothetical protein